MISLKNIIKEAIIMFFIFALGYSASAEQNKVNKINHPQVNNFPNQLERFVSSESYIYNKKLKNYKSLLRDIIQIREELKKEYIKANSEEKKYIIKENRNYIFDALTKDIFPLWYGTKWDYNGHTTIPNGGSIACGFFVTTTLKDAGFNLDRIKLGRQPSEYIIKNLTDERNIRRYSNKNIDYITKEIKSMGNGLYIVGLDITTGFIVYNGKTNPKFIHSSYYNPPLAVVSEELDSFNSLKHSKYRVVGKILNNEMIKKWIKEEKFLIKYDFFKEK